MVPFNNMSALAQVMRREVINWTNDNPISGYKFAFSTLIAASAFWNNPLYEAL